MVGCVVLFGTFVKCSLSVSDVFHITRSSVDMTHDFTDSFTFV